MGGFGFSQDPGEPFQIKTTAQRPPEAALTKGDFWYNTEETTQTGRIYDDGEFGKSAETSGRARRRTERSTQSREIHPADITVVSNFGHQCDHTPLTIERVWGFLHAQGQLLRTQQLLALPLIRIGTWRVLVSTFSKKSRSPEVFEELIEHMGTGTVIDFAQHFPTLPTQKGTDRPNETIREQWLQRIFGPHQKGAVVTLHTLRDQFKVYMIMCNMKVADIEMMMNQLEISSTTQGFLEAEADASVAFERLQILHQCCTDHVYRNESVMIQIYQSRVKHWLRAFETNWVRITEMWMTTATPPEDSPGEVRTRYSAYREWLYDALHRILYFPRTPARRFGEADPSRCERLTIQADPTPPPTTIHQQWTSTTSGGQGGRRQPGIKFGSTC